MGTLRFAHPTRRRDDGATLAMECQSETLALRRLKWSFYQTSYHQAISGILPRYHQILKQETTDRFKPTNSLII